MRTVFTLCLTGFLSACPGPGPDTGVGDAPAPALTPAFSGAWSGGARLALPNDVWLSFPLTLTLSTDGATLAASGFCSTGGGSVAAFGSGQLAEWRGTVECPAPTPACRTATLVFTRGTFTLSDNGAFSAAAHGYYVRCENDDVPVSLVLDVQRHPVSTRSGY